MSETAQRADGDRQALPAGTTGQRIGLMGGTFDPIHAGHLRIAEAARRELSLDAVLFVPTGVSYLKAGKRIAPREDRFQMTALAIADNPRFFVSRMEIDRPGNTYTADTLRELDTQYAGNEWFLLMGADAYLSIDTWVRPEEIAARAVFVCAARGDAHTVDGAQAQQELLARRFGARTVFLSTGRFDLSSTEIRERIAAGRSVRELLPDGVIDYIRKKGLYRT